MIRRRTFAGGNIRAGIGCAGPRYAFHLVVLSVGPVLVSCSSPLPVLFFQTKCAQSSPFLPLFPPSPSVRRSSEERRSRLNVTAQRPWRLLPPHSCDPDHWPRCQLLLVSTCSLRGPRNYSLTLIAYRVQNTSKVITWTYTQGDPSPITILITNDDTNVLNGAFSVAEYIDISAQVKSTRTRSRF